jgi:hypothetical protein
MITLRPLLAFVLLVSIYSCSVKKTGGYAGFNTECLGVEMDGTQTVKAWGKGRNRADAVEQAKKNAIRDVLFRGISSGSDDCEKRPLVFEVNAQERYSDYFNLFFSDGGEYSKYISYADERVMKTVYRDRMKTGEERTYGILIRIDRTKLKKKLLEDKIIQNN